MISASSRRAGIPNEAAPARDSILGDIVRELDERAARMTAAGDGRAAYCELLAGRVRRIEAFTWSLRDPRAAAWLARVEAMHARAYLRALDGWDARDFALTPAPWRAAFAILHRRSIGREAALMLQQRVHNSYDLPLALARAGTLALTRDERRGVFDAATRVASRATRIGPMCFGGDVALWNARDHAWTEGLALRSGDEHARTRAVTRIEVDALRACRAALPAR
jgi:hypothetical protein